MTVGWLLYIPLGSRQSQTCSTHTHTLTQGRWNMHALRHSRAYSTCQGCNLLETVGSVSYVRGFARLQPCPFVVLLILRCTEKNWDFDYHGQP